MTHVPENTSQDLSEDGPDGELLEYRVFRLHPGAPSVQLPCFRSGSLMAAVTSRAAPRVCQIPRCGC